LKLQKIFNSLQENFEKIVFVHLFHFTFSVFLVSEKLLSKYEHLLILTDIAVSTLCNQQGVNDKQRYVSAPKKKKKKKKEEEVCDCDATSCHKA
jgi:hypothetical protein